MSEITYRLVKGKELTFEEIDRNFSALDSDIRWNKRYFDSQLEQFGLSRDSDFLDILAQRDSDAAAIILYGIARLDSEVARLDGLLDSEHAWNVIEHNNLQNNIDSVNSSLILKTDSLNGKLQTNVNLLQNNIDSVNSSLILKTDSLNGKLETNVNLLQNNIDNINNDLSGGNVSLANAFSVQGTSFDGSSPESVTFSGGTGITVTGTTITNSAPDQTVSITGGGSTTVTGTYPNFTVSSTDSNTTYTAGNGLTLTGTEFTMSGSYTGTFTATGDVVAYSDVALKSEVSAIDHALDKLLEITGYTYKKEGSDRRHAGVMAQDVEKVLPEVVHTSEEGIKGVAYGNMMGLVIEAIRELKTQVEELKSK